MGLGTAIEHAVSDHKSGVTIPSGVRLSAANVAKRESRRDYESYLDVQPGQPRKELVLNEDIEALVDQFNLSFGSRYSDLKQDVNWSNFANRGVKKEECGASKLAAVWPLLSKWVDSLTTVSEGGDRSPIFEPPDVDDSSFIDLDMGDSDDSDGEGGVLGANDGDDGDDGGAGGGGQVVNDDGGSWAVRAASAWMKTHKCNITDPGLLEDRRAEIETLFQRASRRRNLFEKRAKEAKQLEAEERRIAEEAVAEFEVREAAAEIVQHEVEEIRGKWVDDDGETHYRIKWLNFHSSRNTWEKIENLAGSEMLITKFEEKFKSVRAPVVSIHQFTQTGRKRRKKRK
jgi:hypothetical protein